MSEFSSESSDPKKKYGAVPNLPDVGNIDINKIYRPRPPQSSGPDYLPYNQRRGRDFYSRLSFNTGVFWLGGFSMGGVYGFAEGWRNAPHPSFKVRFNSVLNGLSRRGSILGSNLGIVDQLELDDRTGTELASPIFAGLTTGSLFMSARGPRAAALAGVIGTVASVGYWYGSSYIYNVILQKGGKF